MKSLQQMFNEGVASQINSDTNRILREIITKGAKVNSFDIDGYPAGHFYQIDIISQDQVSGNKIMNYLGSIERNSQSWEQIKDVSGFDDFHINLTITMSDSFRIKVK